jgi:probable HAF family extracellular repeat protein
MIRRFAITALAAAALAACDDPTRTLGPRAAAPLQHAGPSAEYSVTDLGTLGGSYSFAEGINELGLVVGTSETASGAFRAFVWVPDLAGNTGSMQDLGTLPGWDCSGALGINRRGDIVGYACVANLAKPVVWRKLASAEGYAIEELPGLGGHKGSANAINDRGDIGGNSCTVASIAHAMLWSRGSMGDLGTVAGKTAYIQAMNEVGELTVIRDLGEASFTISYVWSETGGFRDVGNLGGTGPFDGTLAQAINNRGEVTGASITADGEDHAYIWTEEDGIRDIGTLGGTISAGEDINDAGDIVGGSTTAAGIFRAFLWDRRRGMIDLGALVTGGSSWASAINGRGVIVGGSDMAGPEFHAVLWRRATTE